MQQLMIETIFDYYGAPILVVLFIILFFLETKFQLRKSVQARWFRLLVNAIVAIPSFALLRFMFIPVLVWLAAENQNWRFGLTFLLPWPEWMKGIIAFLLLDYLNYAWHILLHKFHFLWRFHLVHHTDLDLDVSTAFRFHFGEIIGSVFFRGAAVMFIGTSPALVLIYEIVFEAATQFHHCNTKLPIRIEKWINYIFVTPRMHGIHHSIIKKEADSNFSVIFSFWDRLHHTVRLNIPQDEIVIGMPSYADEKELTIGRLLMLPFTKIRKWKPVSRVESGKPNELKS